MTRFYLIALLSLLPGVALAQPVVATAPASDWSFAVAPYLWVAGVKIDTRLDRVPPSTPPETTRFETKITGGALLEARAHYKNMGLLVDLVWLRVNTASVSPGPAFSALNLESSFLHSTMAFTYALPTTAGWRVELLAGARFWSVSQQLTATAGTLPGFVTEGDKTWVSPAVGAVVRYDLDKKWGIVGQGMVNVFGGESEGWELFGGATYRFSPAWTGMLGYRFLHEEFSQSRFQFKTDIQGFILGAGYAF